MGVAIIRIIVFWGLDGGPPILEDYHCTDRSLEILPRPSS